MTKWVVGRTRGTIQQKCYSSLFCRRPVWAVLAWAGMSSLWCCPSSISFAITTLPTLLAALKDGFGEAVVVCDMSEPCKFSCLDRCQKSFLWTHKEADLAPHPVVGRQSVYCHACYAYCQGFLACLFLHFRSIHLHFFQNLSRFFPVLAMANTWFLCRPAE